MIQAQFATGMPKVVPIEGRTTTTEVTSKFVRAAARPSWPRSSGSGGSRRRVRRVYCIAKG